MKLGIQTASLTNHIHARGVVGQPEPTVGMGATILCWTDRHAATIVAWDPAKAVLQIRRDRAVAQGPVAFTESQSYQYEPDPQGALTTFRRRPSGMWQEVRLNQRTGRLNQVKGGGHGLRIGAREEYRDPSF